MFEPKIEDAFFDEIGKIAGVMKATFNSYNEGRKAANAFHAAMTAHYSKNIVAGQAGTSKIRELVAETNRALANGNKTDNPVVADFLSKQSDKYKSENSWLAKNKGKAAVGAAAVVGGAMYLGSKEPARPDRELQIVG